MTKEELRITRPSEKIVMHAHKGECHYCNDIVKMPRKLDTMELEPDQCNCLRCGQHYYVEIEDIKAWELKQWEEKFKE